MWITLDQAKEQVSVHPSNTVHDDKLTRLIDAAERWAANRLNVEYDDLNEFEESPVQSPPELMADIEQAILYHIEAAFDRDENSELLMTRAHDLLWPYRRELGV
jgi:hypothetical protein